MYLMNIGVAWSYLMNETEQNPDYGEIQYAIFASAGCVPSIEKKYVANPQLYNWQRAKELYKKIAVSSIPPFPEQMYEIISNCGESLSQLFGRNVQLRAGERTPALNQCIKSKFPAENNWNLQIEKPSLFVLFEELNAIYDVIRHFNRSPEKEKILKNLTWEKTKILLKATQDLWIWILEKKFVGNELKDQSAEFQEDFS